VSALPIVTDLVLIYELDTSTKTDLNDDSLTNETFFSVTMEKVCCLVTETW
jgi:hypothetical protein